MHLCYYFILTLHYLKFIYNMSTKHNMLIINYILLYIIIEKSFIMYNKLFIEAIIKFVFGVVLVGVLIFLPAGTIYFFNGWLLMSVVFLPIFLVGIILFLKKTKLLEIRLNIKEKQKDQSLIIKLCGIMFIFGFLVAGIGYRFNWYMLPKYIVISATLVFLIVYIIYIQIIFKNKYLSRTVQIQKNQIVIDTGLYKIIRHPMYSISIILFLSMALILGSIYTFVIFLIYPFLIIKRIKYEEKFLETNLNGYNQYKQKVKYRLIPFIW